MNDTLPFAGQTQTSLLHVLMRSSKSLTLEEISAQIGVTRTAARQHVLNLQQGGYIQLTTPNIENKKNRGRPTFEYEISKEGRELFTRQYALFSKKMIMMMKDNLNEKQFRKQMKLLGESIAEDLAHKMPYLKKDKPPSSEAIERMAMIMRELGYDAKQVADDEIIAHNCVFHKLAESCRDVCEVDLTIMEKLTGKKPEHKECMVRGGKVCRFKF